MNTYADITAAMTGPVNTPGGGSTRASGGRKKDRLGAPDSTATSKITGPKKAAVPNKAKAQYVIDERRSDEETVFAEKEDFAAPDDTADDEKATSQSNKKNTKSRTHVRSRKTTAVSVLEVDTTLPSWESLTIEKDDATRHKEELTSWFSRQTVHPYLIISEPLRDRIIDFLHGMQRPERQAEWRREVRLLIWRAVIKSGFFWVNPVRTICCGRRADICCATRLDQP